MSPQDLRSTGTVFRLSAAPVAATVLRANVGVGWEVLMQQGEAGHGLEVGFPGQVYLPIGPVKHSPT